MNIIVNGTSIERCRFYSLDCQSCVLHNTRCICDDYNPYGKNKATTNADRIRAMSDEELAKKMSGLESFALTCGGGWTPEKWLNWLRQEVDNGNNS